MQQEGTIQVNTENIFPIIKKFLYNEHDIFIRELVSNAVDASQKLKTLAALGETTAEVGDLKITVTVNPENKTITISDNGIGMTEDEVKKYLNQVAFSGAEEFVQKYKDQNVNNIIGHFGLGFYSSFMVSDSVEVITKSHIEDAPAVHWQCDGTSNFIIKPADKKERGTDIILHINNESEEFLNNFTINQTLVKFGKFLPIPVFFEDKQVNITDPLWTKKPADLKDEDYLNFYKELYPMDEPPMFWVHLNVDYPFNLTGILYFPAIKQSYEIQKNKIQLFSNQVFVTDEVKDIVPEFLMLLHGVMDSPDIPLNVSRSYLQGDANVKKINNYITKKVADKLEELYKNDRKAYEEKWDSIGLFVKYGMMTDDKFLDKANKFVLFPTVSGEKLNKQEYIDAVKENQTNKDNKQVLLYTNNPVQQDAYIQQAQNAGYKVVALDTLIDAAFINQMEFKWNDIVFKRVDADIVDNLIDEADKKDSVLTEKEVEALKKLFTVDNAQLKTTIVVKGLSPEAQPIIATRPEQMRRMKEMAMQGGPMAAFYANMPDEVILTLNGNHPIFNKIIAEKDVEKQNGLVNNLTDLALLSQGLLNGKKLTEFINRNVAFMN